MERREFLKFSLGAGALALMQLTGFGCKQQGVAGPTVALPPLPYSKEALEPYLSARTVDTHYGKHHQGYVDKVNTLVKNTPYQGKPLSDIILETVDAPIEEDIYNNAAQIFNHTFYWNSMKPLGGGKPHGRMESLLTESFGSYEIFCEEFISAATTQFGSGWTWLIKDEMGMLDIISTSNAETPITDGLIPLITLDVWEHAYYLDYQNQRGEYVKAFLEHLINWDFAEKNLG